MQLANFDKREAVEQHSRQADEFAARYADGAAYRDCFAYSRHRLQACLEQFLPDQGNGLQVLDVGCGTGHHAAWLRERGFTVVGIDGSAAMLQRARAHDSGIPFIQADAEALPVADGRFDIVLCIELLRYLPRMQPCLAELARVLRPGGTCLATASPLFSLNGYPLVNRIARRVRLGNLVRLKQYFTTVDRFRAGSLQAGFRTAEVNAVYCGPINWLERLSPWLLRKMLPAWEQIDSRLVRLSLLRNLSNMLLLRATR